MLDSFIKTAFTKKVNTDLGRAIGPPNTMLGKLNYRVSAGTKKLTKPFKGLTGLLTPAFGIFEGLSARSRVLKEPFVKL